MDAADPSAVNEAPILRLEGVVKRFPGVLALDGAALEIRPGEVHALVGENGAGKSTLIKVITGAHRPEAGTVEFDGGPFRPRGPVEATRVGIAAIYQEFNLVPGLTVRENLFLGRDLQRSGWILRRRERDQARQVLDRLGAGFDPEEKVGQLTVAQQQLTEIARALLSDARLLILDEPTATLTPREVDRLFLLLDELRRGGCGILFVSHRLEEIGRIADRVTVMRDGETLGTWQVRDLTEDQIIEKMVGRKVRIERPERKKGPAGSEAPEPLLRADSVQGGRVRGVSLDLRAGEVVGLAGLVGAGRTELVRLLFGADPLEGGQVLLDGRPVRVRSPGDAIRHGICLLTEDRKTQGLVLGLSARENFALPNLGRWARGGWIDGRAETAAFLRYVNALHIRLASVEQRAAHLSGGNQQKLLVARWLESDSRILLFDEPTRGIDVGAKAEMHALVRDLAARGKAVLVISSELPEILALSDRILVMADGRISGEIVDAAEATQEAILRLAVPASGGVREGAPA